MGRQPLLRRVDFIPQVTYFKPVGVRLTQSQEINLAVEEAEAIRLKDLGWLERWLGSWARLALVSTLLVSVVVKPLN